MSIDHRHRFSRLTNLIIATLLLLAGIPFNISHAYNPYMETNPDDPRFKMVDEYMVADIDLLPEWNPLDVMPEFTNQIVIYDYTTHEERYLPIPGESQLESQQSQSYHPGFLASGQVFGSPGGTDDSELWRYTPIVKVTATFPSGTTASCSGILVDSKHVLTAAHCIYTYRSSRCNPPDTACWAEGIKVKSVTEPNGQSFVSDLAGAGLMTWTAWTTSGNYNFDIAGIELATPIGGATGWHAFGYTDSDSYFTSNTFTSLGYPVERSFDGETLSTWSGVFSDVFCDQLDHNNYSFAGQSGSGVFNSDMTVLGVLSHGTGDPEFPNPYTAHTRITADKFTAFTNWIAQNTPALLDLAVFGVSSTPKTFDRGDPLTALSYYLFNVSTMDQEPTEYTLDVYLSADDIITHGDIHLQTLSGLSSLNSKTGHQTLLTSNLPAIPGDLCVSGAEGAWYYLGAILELSDADLTNNISDLDQSGKIWINGCDSYEPDNTYLSALTLHPPYDKTTHDIIPVEDEDWVTFTLQKDSSLSLETSGTFGDTVLTLYDSNLVEIDSDDDSGRGNFTNITRTCGLNALQPGTYYARVTAYNAAEKIENYTLILSTTACGESVEEYTNLSSWTGARHFWNRF